MKASKAKEPVRIRFKKLADGNQSIYFDIYTNGKRKYEFPKLYLVPETSVEAKSQNTTTMRVALALKAQRIDEIVRCKAGLTSSDGMGELLLSEWIDIYSRKRITDGAKPLGQIHALKRRIIAFAPKIRMKNIDKNFVLDFQSYLLKAPHRIIGTLTVRTVQQYMNVLSAALGRAYRDGVISANPLSKLSKSERVHAPQSTREFLTDKEVQKLIQTKCGNEEVKRAFLFSCFCGLRYSDVISLTWNEVSVDSNGRYTIVHRMQKTKQQIYLPLGKEAVKWILSAERIDEKVFHLPSQSVVLNYIKKWVMDARIPKKVSFHTARHTFATLELTYGADLYTVSKLLGHTNIAVTQIYAKIVDKKKVEAVDLLDKGDWG